MARRTNLHALLASSAVIQAFGLVLTMLLGVVLARSLGPTAYGSYGLAMSVVSLAVIPAQFGLPVFGTREAAAAASTDAGRDGRSVLRWFAVRSSACALGVSMILLIGLALYRPAWSGGRLEPLLASSTIVLASSLLAVAAALTRGFGANLTGQALDLALRPTLAAGGALLVAHTFGLDLKSALWVQCGALFVCVGAALHVLFRITRHLTRGRSYEPGDWVNIAGSIMANSLLGVLGGNYPLLVAGYFINGVPIGLFRVALSSAALLGLPFAVANLAVAPVFAAEWARGEREALDRTASHTTLATFGTTFLAFVAVAIAGRPLLHLLFGQQYTGAYIPLLIVGLSLVVTAAFGPCGTFLNLTGQHKVAMQAFLFSVPSGLVASVALTPFLGINGAALGTVVMAAAWNGYVFIIKRGTVRVPLALVPAVLFALRERKLLAT